MIRTPSPVAFAPSMSQVSVGISPFHPLLCISSAFLSHIHYPTSLRLPSSQKRIAKPRWLLLFSLNILSFHALGSRLFIPSRIQCFLWGRHHRLCNYRRRMTHQHKMQRELVRATKFCCGFLDTSSQQPLSEIFLFRPHATATSTEILRCGFYRSCHLSSLWARLLNKTPFPCE